MRILICALAAMSLAACSTVQTPTARPLNASQIAAMGPTSFVVASNNDGVAKSWFAQDSSATAASQGLIGVFVGAAFDAIMNAAPSRRAVRSAEEVAAEMQVDHLNASLVAQLREEIRSAPVDGAITVSDVATVQKIDTPDARDDAVEVAASYLLSEDASTLRVMVNVTYQNAAIPYATPYTFEGAAPKSELTGPTYRNTFTYYSRQLPLPVLTPELKARIVASVEDSARDEAGALPLEGTDEFKAMTKELEKARDDDLTKGEIAIFLTREWIRNDGALIKAEIEGAHDFIARYAVLDINQTAVPSLTGEDQIMETLADGRIVRRIGAGLVAGSYVSSPGEVAGFATYGNAAGVARLHRDRVQAMRTAARAHSQGQ